METFSTVAGLLEHSVKGNVEEHAVLRSTKPEEDGGNGSYYRGQSLIPFQHLYVILQYAQWFASQLQHYKYFFSETTESF